MAKRKKAARKRSLKEARKSFTKFVLTIGFVTIIAVSCYGVWSIRNILKPISTQASTENTLQVETNEKQYSFFTVNVNDKEVVTSASLIMVDTEENVVKELILPSETLLRLPYGLNEFKLQSLYKMAKLEKPEKPLIIMDQTLMEYFGVATKNILITKRTEENQSFYDWLSMPQTMFSLAFNEEWTNKHITATQSRWELVSIAKDILSIQSQSRDSINLVEYGIGSEKKDIDGSTSVVTDQNKLDTYIKKTFESTVLSEEKANIVIQNSSEVSGLAAQTKRVLTNMGGIVVELKNGEQKQENTTIEINDKKWLESKTLQKILKVLPMAKVEEMHPGEDTGDITISIGKDYATIIYGTTGSEK